MKEMREDNMSVALTTKTRGHRIKGDDAEPSFPHAFAVYPRKSYHALEIPSNGQTLTQI